MFASIFLVYVLSDHSLILRKCTPGSRGCKIACKGGLFFTPPERVTSPTWSPPPPSKQALIHPGSHQHLSPHNVWEVASVCQPCSQDGLGVERPWERAGSLRPPFWPHRVPSRFMTCICSLLGRGVCSLEASVGKYLPRKIQVTWGYRHNTQYLLSGESCWQWLRGRKSTLWHSRHSFEKIGKNIVWRRCIKPRQTVCDSSRSRSSPQSEHDLT